MYLRASAAKKFTCRFLGLLMKVRDNDYDDDDNDDDIDDDDFVEGCNDEDC